jgi:type IV secretion system protein VirB9
MTARLPVFAAIALAMMLCCAPCAALAVAADSRIRTVDYDPDRVVRIEGRFRTATQVLLAPDETVLHAAVGDTTAWDVVADRNVLFLKPKARHGPTDLIVTTALPGGGARNYTFELTSAGTVPTRGGAFVVRFRYPSDRKAAAVAAVSAAEAALQQKALDLKLERAALEGPRNLAYDVQGAEDLQPSEISDNGRFTVMRFPAGQPIPTIYAVSPAGQESLVPFDVRGEFVVVHGTAARFRLRRGKTLLCVWNLAPGPGAANATNTAAPDVARTDRTGRIP